MKQIQIESWTIRVLENVEKHLPIEDSFVELKSEWLDPVKAARRIAAHSNAARGENILWLIGVDETKGVVGADYQELSSWYSAVQSHFDGVTPDLQTINIDYKGKCIAALCFNTTRAPFVVKNPAFGKISGEPVEWEVPWREATKTRSAGRNELILLLSPLTLLPKIEILDAEMQLYSDAKPFYRFWVTAYVVPRNNIPIIFPFHKCAAYIQVDGNQFVASGVAITTPQTKQRKNSEFRSLLSRGNEQPVTNVHVKTGTEPLEVTEDEIAIRGAGKILIEGNINLTAIATFSGETELQITVTLIEAATELKIVLVETMKRENQQGGGVLWKRPAIV